ncbi:MAG: LysR substrate-binding domain-containing protein [Pseudomonadota bacterium]|jgi:LysR family glycine cleavage system transcriptional activator|uniref:LysR family transcriptional regulator, glycine cleavage system transcriptional activator n=1 Tax=Pseudooceanicola nitratireducens TaxID=517719 RepID=A0A1I1IHI4_9RHOB|nr:LysR substrate-binding domain-containing protein [Pseudooceanicola nitratireducens]MEC7297842.1 LysR substrate-binding domain-containing protein [Pseudomonadota bacterium]MBY6164585.1 LysR family transcriptional regulator [Pseudooceanicola nitratireducens]MEC8667451.1 LysR substrate-binding domain-containing protein [Pseudomonadota bacterium]SEJ20683.1 LysR family transcriptional regulator, glycine cleavage system transcriptional activator [Pseudooceanicola nitratireducens]SFC32690.1 LysR f
MRHSYTPTLAELEAFCACAQSGTTIRAAEVLGRTQSAVSRAIGGLEAKLGVPLFLRARQRLTLSDAGRAFLREAAPLLDQLNEAAMTVMAFGGQARVLRIAVLPTFGRLWLIPRLRAFQATMPDLSIDMAARLTPVDFALDPFDVAIQRTHHRASGAAHDHLLDEELAVLAAPSLVSGPLSPQDVLRLPLLQQSTRPTLWPDWCRAQGLDPRLALRGARFDHFDMVLDAAQAGLGVALVPEILARAALDRGDLLRAVPGDFATGQAYTLIYPDQSRDLPHFARFRDWLRAEIEGIWA